jgi:menaquinone-dependent protoporphyrinogen oxidase
VGAAVYLLRWHPDVLVFLHAHERALATRHVWLFESGPLDDLPETRVRELPSPVAVLADRILIRGHVTFGGCLRPETEGVLEQLMAVGGLVGDYREWDRVRAWAGDIALEIADGHRVVAV